MFIDLYIETIQCEVFCQWIMLFVIMQINLCESHWLLRRVFGFILTAVAVYMVNVTSRELH